MINNPDGTHRVPTPQEVLEHVKSQRLRREAERNSLRNVEGTPGNTTGTTGTNIDNRGSSQGANGNSQHLDNTRLSETSTDNRNDGIVESEGSSSRRIAEPAGSTGGESARRDTGVSEHSWRTTADSSTTSHYPEPVKQPVKNKSRFGPYREAISEAFSRKKKEEKKNASTKTSRVLSESEARSHRETLIEVMLWQTEHMDNFIIATTRGHNQVVIWSDIDRSDATILTDYLLDEGKKSPKMATVVRNMVELRRKVQVGLITLPRAYRTMQVYFERGIGIR